MTAIVTVYTADGFIIGADGRRFDSKTKTIETDTAQKVFWFESKTIRLAYAWTGTTEASDHDGSVWDLITATREGLPFASNLAMAGFISFLSGLRNRLSTTVPPMMINMDREELARAVF